MKLSRTDNAIRTILSNIILQMVNVICGLILPPLIIREYGSETNGLVSTIRQLLTYFSIVSVGLGASCQVALYKPINENNYNDINGVMSATRKFFNKAGIVFSALIGIASLILPIVINSELNYQTIFAIIWICGIGSACEFIITNKYKVFLNAEQRLYVVAKIEAEGTIINTLLSVIMIHLHCSIIVVQLISTLAYLIRMISMILYVKRKYPELNVKAKPNYGALKDKWKAVSYQAANMIINYTPPLLVAAFCGLIDASIFSVYNMIFAAISMIVNIFSTGLSSMFGNMIIRKEKENLEKTFKAYSILYNFIMLFMYGCAMILIIPFISVYIKNSDGVNYLSSALGITFALNGIAKNLRVPYSTIVEANGSFNVNSKLNMIEAIANIILSIILVKIFGLKGIIIAGIIVGGIRSVIYMKFVSDKIIKISYMKALFKTLIYVLVIFVLYYLLRIEVDSYITWIINAIKTTFIMGISLLIITIIIDKQSFSILIDKIKNYIHNKKRGKIYE